MSNMMIETQDCWERMRTCGKPVVLYGMGNGADKILSVMERYGIEAADFFASDGFVRGHSFHGKQVLSYSAAREKYPDMMVVICFGSSRPEVLDLFRTVDAAYETVAPDVPVAGDALFTHAYYEEHRLEFEHVYERLADEQSRALYEAIINYKITGKLSYLFRAVSDPEEARNAFVQPEQMKRYLDLGAYNGDTVRELLAHAGHMEEVFAMEPDARNYKKLSAYAEGETRAAVHTFPYAAWDEDTELVFASEGNRNSTAAKNQTAGITVSQSRTAVIRAAKPDTVLAGTPVDFIKYDVEGAEAAAIRGSAETIRTCRPRLLVSLYHRTEDLFALPMQLERLRPDYRFYLRRFPYVPAWDINLYCI